MASHNYAFDLPARAGGGGDGGRPSEYLVPFLWARPQVRSLGHGRIAFALFLLVNAALFIRPAEILGGMAGWPIYEVLIVACMVASLPGIVAQLSPGSLFHRPITLCLLGLLGTVLLSHLAHGRFWYARMSALEFIKVLVYYLLLAANVDSPQRLRRFLSWLTGLTVALVLLAFLQYYGLAHIAALAPVVQSETDAATGASINVQRLVSTGIFHDPNDLCLLLVAVLTLCIYGLADCRRGRARFMWLVPLALFGWAILLTRSRGGFISLLAALLALSFAHFGWRKTLLVAIGLAPVVLAMGSRQTDLALSHGTGQERIRIWSQGLQLLGQSPFFGIGYGNYAPEVGHVAHNSFLQCYTELGLLGGTFFLGAFFYALWMLWRLRPAGTRAGDSELHRLHPVLSALVFAYAIGMLSLSRSYVVPTYMVLGLAAVYLRAASVGAPAPALRLSARVGAILVAAGAVFIVTTYVFVRLLVHWG